MEKNEHGQALGMAKELMGRLTPIPYGVAGALLRSFIIVS